MKVDTDTQVAFAVAAIAGLALYVAADVLTAETAETRMAALATEVNEVLKRHNGAIVRAGGEIAEVQSYLEVHDVLGIEVLHRLGDIEMRLNCIQYDECHGERP